ncbi:unnamed protein product [Clonostachys rosea f. rosea IK726]|uniref:Uncharacterized protein n=1 Tax=Clonostachys rosea f. rosea IK726 TaxID=1349383 RepID=A0ACA9T9H6_BIOOC|nr:unnamed protein product [Clonostachys rosea f. rosea IK726]
MEASATQGSSKPPKEQPWKVLFAESTGARDEPQEPWQNWEPDAAKPDEKPWIAWMNNEELGGKQAQRKATEQLKERGRTMGFSKQHSLRRREGSSKGTVAEGG